MKELTFSQQKVVHYADLNLHNKAQGKKEKGKNMLGKKYHGKNQFFFKIASATTMFNVHVQLPFLLVVTFLGEKCV